MDDEYVREKQKLIWPEVIGLVITKNDQKISLCPINFQSISTVFEKPLTVCIGLDNNSHTLKEVLVSCEFVYSYPSKEQLKDTLYCGTVSGASIDKLANTEFKFEPSEKVKTPCLIGAVANYECKVTHTHNVGAFTVVLGEIQQIHTYGKANLDKIYSLGGEEDQHNYGIIESVKPLQHGR